MKRYFDPKYENRFYNDFQFLFRYVKDSEGEYDLRIRDNYFNLYYRGNSMAKVSFRKKDYRVEIHKKFLNNVYDKDTRFRASGNSKNYEVFLLGKKQLRPFLQKKYLEKIGKNVKDVNYQEEIVFEQILITDNRNKEDIILIDRQVMDNKIKRRMDLLCLEKIGENNFSFEVIEVKCGNSKDLEGEVINQLQHYLKHVKNNISTWKNSYEKTYYQMKKAGLFEKPKPNEINIIEEVKGKVVVMGYSGIADRYVNSLRKKSGNIEVKQFKNELK